MAALLVPGLVFFTALVLVAIANTQNVTTKAQTESQGSVLKFFKDAITGKAAVHAITQLTRAAISRWALAQMKPVTAWFVALNALVINIFRTQTDVLEGTADSLERLRGHTIPQAVGKASAPANAKAKAAQTKAGQASATATATAAAFKGYRTSTAPKLAHATRAVDVTLPQSIGRIKTAEDKLASDQSALRERTKALENGAVKAFEWITSHPLSAATAVFSGAVAVALNRLGYGFLRCRNWRNAARRVDCGMGAIVDDLLAIGFAYSVVVDPVAIAKAANEAEDVIDSLIRRIAD